MRLDAQTVRGARKRISLLWSVPLSLIMYTPALRVCMCMLHWPVCLVCGACRPVHAPVFGFRFERYSTRCALLLGEARTNTPSRETVMTISSEDLVALLKDSDRGSLAIIDARPYSVYALGHIGPAINIRLSCIMLRRLAQVHPLPIHPSIHTTSCTRSDPCVRLSPG